MVTVIIFNSGVVATKKTNMPCCGTYLDLALVSFSGLIQPYIYNDVRNAITYERPLPGRCVFTRERSERDTPVNLSAEIAFAYSYIGLFLAQN